VSDIYCDGLGACLGECPQDAITIEEREAPPFDEQKAKEWMASQSNTEHRTPNTACLGTRMQAFTMSDTSDRSDQSDGGDSALQNWPVQLRLVPPFAPYFQNADILLAADCVPFACPDFHRKVLAGKVLVIGCPKLDDAPYYVEKLSQILATNDIKSLSVARMEVPCCSGLTRIARMAVDKSGNTIPVKEIIFSIRGEEPAK
jgi:ferredoxin